MDLDKCIDTSTSNITNQKAQQMLSLLPNTYTEKSVSGRGIHILCKGNLPKDCYHRNDKDGIEIYDTNRFICMTGDLLNDTAIIQCIALLFSVGVNSFMLYNWYIDSKDSASDVGVEQQRVLSNKASDTISFELTANDIAYYYESSSGSSKSSVRVNFLFFSEVRNTLIDLYSDDIMIAFAFNLRSCFREDLDVNGWDFNKVAKESITTAMTDFMFSTCR
ncbi:MAG: hypothetical protein LBU60_06165 [Clostridiales bacterium]|jgi:primase-polymerase (primpol)-like protein|nr:hypothetical protein [Clostridiales bacterium]